MPRSSRATAAVAASAVAVMLVLATPVPTVAAPTSVNVGDFSFQGDPANPSAGATLTQCLATVASDIVIPDRVAVAGIEMDVVAIADEACHRSKIGSSRTSVTIPDSVRSVGAGAFQNLELASVSLGDGLESIGSSSFANNHLQEVHLPAGVTEVPYRAFAANWMTSFSVSGTGVVLGEESFEGNNFQGLTIPDGVVEIGPRALQVDAMYDVRIPASVTTIAADAFGTDYLQSVFFEGALPDWPSGASTIDIVNVYYYVGAAGFEFADLFVFPDSTVTQMVKVTFDTGGHVTPPAPVDVPTGSTTTAPTLGARPTFDFVGWFDAPTGGTAWSFATATVANHITLYARWVDTPESLTAPATAEQGDAISVSGAGFQANEDVELWLLAAPVLLATLTADADGTFATTVTVPYSVSPGPDTLEARGAQSASVSRSLTVVAGPPPNVGDTVVINGMEFRVLTTSPYEASLVRCLPAVADDIVVPERVTIKAVEMPVTHVEVDACSYSALGGVRSSVTLPHTVRTIEAGAFAGLDLTTFRVPFSITYIGTDALGGVPLTWAFFDGDEPTLDADWANVNGTTVYYYKGAAGFDPGDWPVSTLVALVRVSFDTGGIGTAPASIEMPAGDPLSPPSLPDRPTFDFAGWYDAPAGGNLVNLSSIDDHMTLYARWVDTPESLDAPPGSSPGDTITLKGAGYQSGEALEIWLLSTPVQLATVTADASGTFSVTVTIPASTPPGAHTLEVRGAQSGVFARSFTVYGALPQTGPGPSVGLIAAAAFALVGVGAMLIRRGRRGHAQHE